MSTVEGESERERPVDVDAQGAGYDVLLASCLWLISLGALVESIRLSFFVDIPGTEDGNWLIAPGMMPMFLSGGLLIMLSAVIMRTWKRNTPLGGLITIWVNVSENRQKAGQALLLLIFVFGLVGHVHFGIAAGLYLFAATALARAAKLHWLALIAIIFAGSVSLIFGTLMKIPLP